MYLLIREKYTFTVIGVVFNERKLNTLDQCNELIKEKEEEFRKLMENKSTSIIKEYEIGKDVVSYHYNKFYVTAIPLKKKKEGLLYTFLRLIGFPCLDQRDVLGFGEQQRIFILTIGEFKNDVFEVQP